MSSRDRLIEQLLKAQPDSATQRLIDQAMKARPDSATQRLIEQAQEVRKASSAVQQLIDSKILQDYNDIGRYAAEAIAKTASSNVQRIIQELARSPVIPSYLRDIQSIVIPAMSQQFAKALRMSAIIPDIQPQAIRALVESADSMRRIGIERIVETLSNQTKNIPYRLLGSMTESAALAAFKQIQPQISGIQDAINTTFAGTLAEALRHALKVRDEESFDRVEALINDKFADLPHNEVASEGAWRTFLTILAVLIAFGSLSTDIYQAINTHESSNTQSTQFQQLTDLLKQIAINIELRIPEKDENIYYVVERQVPIQIKPKFKSPTIAVLFPNQKVRLVRDNHKWIYVEYFDYLEGIPRYGWTNKKYLKKLKAMFKDKETENSVYEYDETAYLLRSPANRERLLRAIGDIESSQNIVVPQQERSQ